MMARRGEAVWQAPHNEPQRRQRARQALPKGASRCPGAQFRRSTRHRRLAAASSPHPTSEALSERDLISASLGCRPSPAGPDAIDVLKWRCS